MLRHPTIFMPFARRRISLIASAAIAGCPLLLLSLPALAQRKTANPLDHLPPQIEILTHFGERADISPNNQQVAFMDKSFGDAFVIDLKSRIIRCLTCNVPGAAFLRIMHLSSGDYILIGPARFSDIHTSRSRGNELWFLSRKPGSKPQTLNQKMSEGVALSKKALKIAYSVTHAQNPSLAVEQSQLFVADIDTSGATPWLANPQMVYESLSKACTIEAQDFFDNDQKMTFTCYEPQGLASVMTIDLATRKVQNMSKAPGTYNECEGIYPDGVYTNVEGDRQVDTLGGRHGSGNIDIWKLRLDGTGKDFKRLTTFNDYEGYKASNPVVSTDGRFMAFQVAHPTDEAGVGYGILLYHFR
jgi:Tol biopolymer transport system component